MFADADFTIFDSGYCNLKQVVGFGEVYAKSTTTSVSLQVSSGTSSSIESSNVGLTGMGNIPEPPDANMILLSYMENQEIKKHWVSSRAILAIAATHNYFKSWNNLAVNGTLYILGKHFSGEFVDNVKSITLDNTIQPLTLIAKKDDNRVYSFNLYPNKETGNLVIETRKFVRDAGSIFKAEVDVPLNGMYTLVFDINGVHLDYNGSLQTLIREALTLKELRGTAIENPPNFTFSVDMSDAVFVVEEMPLL